MSRADKVTQMRARRAARGDADPLTRLRHHVTGAIERGEATAIVEQPARPGRKDYGCPLRIYAHAAAVFTLFPPRAGRAWARYRNKAGAWESLQIHAWSHQPPTGHQSMAFPGPHLGRRIAWAELPEPVQQALRASFLGNYCPAEVTTVFRVSYPGFLQQVERDFPTEAAARQWARQVGHPDAPVIEVAA